MNLRLFLLSFESFIQLHLFFQGLPVLLFEVWFDMFGPLLNLSHSLVHHRSFSLFLPLLSLSVQKAAIHLLFNYPMDSIVDNFALLPEVMIKLGPPNLINQLLVLPFIQYSLFSQQLVLPVFLFPHVAFLNRLEQLMVKIPFLPKLLFCLQLLG